MEDAKGTCERKLRKYNRLLRTFDPDKLDSATLGRNGELWTKEIWTALDDMVESIEAMSIAHGQDLANAEVVAWKNEIALGEDRFREFVNKVSTKAGDQLQLRSDTSGFQPLSSSVVQPGVAGHQSQQESRDWKAAKIRY